MIAYFLFALFFLEGLAAMAFLWFYKLTKEQHVFYLGAWFATRFLSLVFADVADRFLGWSTLPVLNISVLIEGILMVCFFQSIVKISTRSVKYALLFLAIAFTAEVYLNKSLSKPFYVLNIAYYLMVCAQLLWLIMKVKPDAQLNYFLQVLFVFHAVVFIYMLNATLIIFNVKVFNLVYPVLWLCMATLDLLAIIFIRKAIQNPKYYLNS